MDMIDMTIGATWLFCCVFAAFRVYSIEKNKAGTANPQALPVESAQPINKWKALIPFFMTLVLFCVMLVSLMIIFPDNLPDYLIAPFLAAAAVLYGVSTQRSTVIWASPAAFACFSAAGLTLLITLHNQDILAQEYNIPLLIGTVLLCCILSALQYLFVMTKKKA